MSDVRLVFDDGALRALLKGTNGEVARDLSRRGKNVARRASELAPKASGNLSRKIKAERPHIGSDGELEVTIIADTDYSIYVEKGTRNMAARPFMAPALSEASA